VAVTERRGHTDQGTVLGPGTWWKKKKAEKTKTEAQGRGTADNNGIKGWAEGRSGRPITDSVKGQKARDQEFQREHKKKGVEGSAASSG